MALLRKDVKVGMPKPDVRPVKPNSNPLKPKKMIDTSVLTKTTVDVSKIIKPTGITNAVPMKTGVSTQIAGTGSGVWSKVLDIGNIVFSNADKIITGIKGTSSTATAIPQSAIPFANTPPISPSGVYTPPKEQDVRGETPVWVWIVVAFLAGKILRIF